MGYNRVVMGIDQSINNLVTPNLESGVDLIPEIDSLVKKLHLMLVNNQLTKSKIIPYKLFISDLQMAKTLLEANGIFKTDLLKIKSDYAIFADNLTEDEIDTVDKIIVALNSVKRLDGNNDITA